MIHCMRRNLDVNILLFNNQIYGLTKEQYSPTSEFGKRTKSSPLGTIEQPIHPVEMALAAEATFVARTVVFDPEHLGETIEAAARHQGTSFVEICRTALSSTIGCWAISPTVLSRENWVGLEHGKPIRFGAGGRKGIVLPGAWNRRWPSSARRGCGRRTCWFTTHGPSPRRLSLGRAGRPISPWPTAFSARWKGRLTTGSWAQIDAGDRQERPRGTCRGC